MQILQRPRKKYEPAVSEIPAQGKLIVDQGDSGSVIQKTSDMARALANGLLVCNYSL